MKNSVENIGPFSGIRVLDLGSMIAGPGACGILGDQGAEVIKVEPPITGDKMRYFGAHLKGISAMYHCFNRGKRSMTLDLKCVEGISILKELVRHADVLVENFRPGVAEKLGINYEELREYNDQLIYVSISGFGETGPMANKPAYDNVIQAISGLAASQANTETQEPTPYYQLVVDKLTALTASQAISAALFARQKIAKGQKINLSMLDAVVRFLWADTSGTKGFLGDGAIEGMSIAGSRFLKNIDGYSTFAFASDKQFQNFCKAFDMEEIDPRLETIGGRNDHLDLFANLLKDVREKALSMTVYETIEAMEALDVPCAPSMNLTDLPEHPQAIANATFETFLHPIAGEMQEPRDPCRFSQTPSPTINPSHSLGEDTKSILSEIGLDIETITSFTDRGIVG